MAPSAPTSQPPRLISSKPGAPSAPGAQRPRKTVQNQGRPSAPGSQPPRRSVQNPGASGAQSKAIKDRQFTPTRAVREHPGRLRKREIRSIGASTFCDESQSSNGSILRTSLCSSLDLFGKPTRRLPCFINVMSQQRQSAFRQRTEKLQERTFEWAARILDLCPRQYPDDPSRSVWRQLIRAAPSASGNLEEADEASPTTTFFTV